MNPYNPLHIYAKMNQLFKEIKRYLDQLPGGVYTIYSHDNIQYNCKYPVSLISGAPNQKQENTRRLIKHLQLQICAKVKLTANSNLKDCLINGQVGGVPHIKMGTRAVKNIYLKFLDEDAGVNTMTSCCQCKQNYWAPIEKCENDFSIKKNIQHPQPLKEISCH